MKPLYTKEQFDLSKSSELLPCECLHCGKTFRQPKNFIQSRESGKKNGKRAAAGNFCSQKCSYESRITSISVICVNCGKIFKKIPFEIKKSKSGNQFCSSSCAAIFNNTHKTKGNRRSKLEIYLEKELHLLYPELKMDFNKTDAINSELDIYIPSLNLAFELNGIFHYEPIYGQGKLDKVQNNDNRKFQACVEKKIELCIIDTSQQKYFKEESSKKFLNIIVNIINNKDILIQKQASNLQPPDYESGTLPIKAILE